jgi:hypothetical protein
VCAEPDAKKDPAERRGQGTSVESPPPVGREAENRMPARNTYAEIAGSVRSGAPIGDPGT